MPQAKIFLFPSPSREKAKTKKFPLYATLIWIFLVAAPAFAAKSIPPSPYSYVYNEGVVSPATERTLSEALRAFELRTGHQFVLGLFQSLDGESLEDYSNRVFRAWKIGSKKQNDGLLICVFLKDRRWRAEVGYGLEPVLTDLEAAEFIREYAVPYFKEGNYDAGVQAAVQTLTAKLSGEGGQAPVSGQASVNSIYETLQQRREAQRDEMIRLQRIAQMHKTLKALGWSLVVFFFIFWYTYEHGIDWSLREETRHKMVDHGGWSFAQNSRYPIRFLIIVILFVFLFVKLLFELVRLLFYFFIEFVASGGGRGGSWSSGSLSGGGYSDGWGGGGFGGGGFSGGGGSSGGGGASGGW